MPKTRELTQAQVRARLDYDPATGWFSWRWRPEGPAWWNTTWAGKPAGTVKDGYIVVCVDRTLVRAHLLAFLWMTGRMPKMVDHRDTDRSNNRWRNLREATYSQNFANGPLKKTNTSGFKGVDWHSQSQSWRAKIQVNGRSIHLGLFSTKEAAAAAYAAAAVKHYGEFARPS